MNGRSGGKEGSPVPYDEVTLDHMVLYDLENDVAESKDVSADHPAIVAQLQQQARQAREELGDSLSNKKGRAVRPVGRIQKK